jgi:hypothetical protein
VRELTACAIVASNAVVDVGCEVGDESLIWCYFVLTVPEIQVYKQVYIWKAGESREM